MTTQVVSAPHQRWVRIIPVAFLMYTIAFMDRINVGFGFTGMEKALGFGSEVSGLVGGIFFFGYMFLQIPGGHLAMKWSAKKFVTIFLIAWGLFAILTGLVQNTAELLIVRFLLGVAGGIALLLSGLLGSTSAWLGMIFLILTEGFMLPYVGVFWTLPPLFLHRETLGSGMGLINALGNLGGFVGPFLVGYFISSTGSTLTGIVLLCIALVLAGLMTIVFRYQRPALAYQGRPEMPGASTEVSDQRTVPPDRHRIAS